MIHHQMMMSLLLISTLLLEFECLSGYQTMHLSFSKVCLSSLKQEVNEKVVLIEFLKRRVESIERGYQCIYTKRNMLRATWDPIQENGDKRYAIISVTSWVKGIYASNNHFSLSKDSAKQDWSLKNAREKTASFSWLPIYMLEVYKSIVRKIYKQYLYLCFQNPKTNLCIHLLRRLEFWSYP